MHQGNVDGAARQEAGHPENGHDRAGNRSKNQVDEWILKLFNTREFNVAMAAVLPELFRYWAGDSRLKRLISRPVTSSVRNTFARDGETQRRPDVADILEDPELLAQVTEAVPYLLGQGTRVVSSLMRSFQELPDEDRRRVAVELLKSLNVGSNGEMLAGWVKLMNKIQRENPEFLTEYLKPHFEDLLKHVDFGELRELADRSSPALADLVGEFMDVLFQYPAKLVLSISFLPAIANLGLSALLEVLKRYNTMAPDLMCDVAMAMLNELDGERLGRIINETSELSRKLHTGSALLGEPGNPMFPEALSTLLETTLRQIDGVLFLKAREGFTNGVNTFDRVMKETLARNNEHLLMHLSLSASRRNLRHQSRIRSLAMLTDMPEEELAPAMEHAASTWNAHDVAEIVNLFATLINRAHRENPAVLSTIVAEAASALDEYEVGEMVETAFAEYGHEMRPFMRTVLPTVIEGVCDWLEPGDDDGNQERIDHALGRLRDLMANAG
ncbi:MAG: hypothetical protein ACLFOY_04805 [Desulfatibacillaceae bacterium]